jgi:hypothetical protein
VLGATTGCETGAENECAGRSAVAAIGLRAATSIDPHAGQGVICAPGVVNAP